MNNIREHKHRLPRERYMGTIAVAFTICISGKRKLFTERSLFQPIERILFDVINNHMCDAHIYLFMPDHLHLLLQGKKHESNLWKCVVNFKQRSGYWLARNGFEEKWQKDFYDHIMRKDEDIIKQVRYILQNPVRKGLVENWRDYKFKGSTIYDFNEW